MSRLMLLPRRGDRIRWRTAQPMPAPGGYGEPTVGRVVVRRLSVALAARGLLALAFGLLALLWPGVTVLALALLFGVYAIVDGVGMLAYGLVRARRRRWGYLLAGAGGLVAGLLTLWWPQITALALVVIAGLWGLGTGLVELAAAVRLRGAGARRWLLAGVGFASLLAGVAILAHPGFGVLALATVLGAYALLAGVVLLGAAWQLRREYPTAGGL